MKIGTIIYEECDGIEKIAFNSEFIGISGIWALYGKESVNFDYTCINVGKCEDIGKEIIYDLGCLHCVPFRKGGTKKYVNQFGKYCGFEYQTGQTQEYLYPYIALHYQSIKFVYVCNDNDIKKEREYAEKEQAFFWRNGGVYGGKHEINWSRKDLQTIGNYFYNGGETYSLEELLNKIEEDLGFDDTRGKKLINESERLGIIYCMSNKIYTR